MYSSCVGAVQLYATLLFKYNGAGVQASAVWVFNVNDIFNQGRLIELLVNHNGITIVFHAMKLRKAFEKLIK
jgi:hypothetical protein